MRGILAGLVVVPALLAGCFSDDPGTEPTGPGAPDVECSVAIPEPGAGEAVVAIRDFAFHPADLEVAAGTEVTWVNCEDATGHTTTSDDGVWDSGLLAAGESYSRTFAAAGRLDYHCTPHPFMQGSVTVEP